MPEGDSVASVAERLRPRLVGEVLRDVRTRGDAPVIALVGQRVLALETHGKHLLLRPEHGPSARVHLGMYGRWRRFEPGVRWRRPRRTASLILATDAHVFACFRAHVELLRGALPERDPSLVHLGPDLLVEAVDLERVVARAQLDPQRPIGSVLLDQRVAAGIGNVYANEVLFLARLAPHTPVGEVPPDALRGLYALAARLMRANVGARRRVTRGIEAGEPPWRPGTPRTYVYGRAGRPCPRCAATLRSARRGELKRVTTWCPRCQPEPGEATNSRGAS
ncbi:MAG: hypothetical protein KDD82_05680 [Planctomycetes bacterium]|nr:hypothetical protein [Planctomycetota bacterium]